MSKGHHRGKGCHSQNEPLFFLSFCSTKVFNFDLCTLARMENLNKTVKAQSNSVKAQKWRLNGIQKLDRNSDIFLCENPVNTVTCICDGTSLKKC